MVATYDFHKIGRAALRQDPHFFSLLNDKIKECQDNSLKDTSLINSYFHYFCLHQQVDAEEIRAVSRRGGLQLMNVRRLFIAVILKLYDQLYYEDIAGRMADNLRKSISDCLNCNEVWVSNVAPSVKHELKRLRDYKEEVQTIIAAIQPKVEAVATDILPEYGNTRTVSHQFKLWE